MKLSQYLENLKTLWRQHGAEFSGEINFPEWPQDDQISQIFEYGGQQYCVCINRDQTVEIEHWFIPEGKDNTETSKVKLPRLLKHLPTGLKAAP